MINIKEIQEELKFIRNCLEAYVPSPESALDSLRVVDDYFSELEKDKNFGMEEAELIAWDKFDIDYLRDIDYRRNVRPFTYVDCYMVFRDNWHLGEEAARLAAQQKLTEINDPRTWPEEEFND